MTRRRVEGSRVVVVGGTSGLGRAVVESLAASGAHIVVAARDPGGVALVVERCTGLGVRAIGVPADIGDPDDVERILETAERELGGVDTWINTAAGLLVGPLEDQPVDEIEQLIRTNVMGTALASRSAMRYFGAQGAGVLINVSSLLGVVPNPVAPTYVMTKFAVRGLTLSLDQATLRRHSPVRACLIMPGPIDTPMFERAANHTGRELRAIPPAFSPERVAAAVLRSVRRPRRQRTTGLTGALVVVGMHVVPRFTETVVAQIAARLIVRPHSAPPTAGDLGRPTHLSRIAGGWRRGRWRVRIGDAVGRRLARS